MMSLGVQSLSTAMVASGGIGIASMIANALHVAADKADSARRSAGCAGETVKIHGKAEISIKLFGAGADRDAGS